MDRSDVLDFVRKNSTSFMATVEDGQPRVRAMDTPHVDEGGLTFCTGTGKDVCRQLLARPWVELCYWSTDEKMQVRIRGRMEELDDPELKRQIVETRFVFLKPVVEQYGWESLTLFRLSSGEVRTWSPLNPAERNPQVTAF
ncbi:MAG: pyridoxamine 5'-phosphate oxidase family protein [Candidatus Fermentibacteraceae bacterium]|nr:pyridoxamine 5'-phosphate oxidase family protein [Candidatus Fermentibacteraceae bacterium]MBN2608891.1 pyridoxamine 5'-phosphate oxidase family protein [Candidatus Fermentibacteraceae bacterium]